MSKSRECCLPEQLILKITLSGSNPPIWRRVEVNSGLIVHDLHYVIQNVFDWDGSHLYEFMAPPGGKLTRKALSEARRYALDPDGGFDDLGAVYPAHKTLVGELFTPDCKKVVYNYDFGDSWEHIVQLEKRTPGGSRDHIPQCLAGANAAPRDDMGGIPGFYMWVAALVDKDSPMHEEAFGWLTKDFDPAYFDLDAANHALAACFKPAPQRARRPRKPEGDSA